MGIEETELECVNHPRSATRVRCSSCDSPICVKCMNETPVGMKCPRCARVEYQKRGDRRRYAAGAAGLISAGALGAVTVIGLGNLNFLVAILLGIVTGAVVRKVGRGRAGLGGTAALAAVFGLALGLLALGAPISLLFSPFFLIPGAVAAGSAALVASR